MPSYHDLLEHLRDERIEPLETDGIDNPVLRKLISVAQEIRLVSGELNGSVYNDSCIVSALRERWESDLQSPVDQRQQAYLGMGPDIHFTREESTPHEDFRNDMLTLIQEHLEDEKYPTLHFYKSTYRQELHFWLVDRRHIFYQFPHAKFEPPSTRDSFYAEAPKTGNWLAWLYDDSISDGIFSELHKKADVKFFSRQDCVTVNRDKVKESSRNVLWDIEAVDHILNNIPPVPEGVPRDFVENYEKYLST